jgi:hypothetical protein
MAKFCLMPDQIQAVKNKLKEKGGEILTMSKEERQTVFNDALKNGVVATELNNRFQKAVEDKRKGALTKWLNTYLSEEVKTKTPEEKQAIEKTLIGAATKLSQKGLLNEKVFDNFIEDAVRAKLGIQVTAEEVTQINDLVKKMTDKKPSGNIGDQSTLDYLEARKAVEDYISSRSQSPFFKQLTGTFGRGNLLFSTPSITTNIIANTALSITEKIKRLAQLNIGKSFAVNGRVYETGANPELVASFIKDAQKIYQKTGIDVTRIMSLADDALLLGESKSNSSYKLFKLYENTIYKQGLGAPDVFYSAYNYASNLNINTTIAARAEGLSGTALKDRAKELFQQASNVTGVRSPEAELLREGATYAAQYATYQNNDRALTTGLLKTREMIDDMFPSLNLGTNLDPFIKTPANVFMTSLDYAGLTAPHALFTLLRETKKESPDVKVIERATGTLIAAGIGQIVAFAIAGGLKDDDYIPDYIQASAKQRELQKLGNGVFYGIKIGDKWVSLVYFGGVGITIAAIMQARQELNKGDSITTEGKVIDATTGAGKAVFAASSQLPLVNHLFQAVQFFQNDYNESGDDKVATFARGTIDEIMSRAIPAFVRTIGNITDPYQRQRNYNLGAKDAVVESFKANIPGLREDLTPKYDTFGNKLENKSAINSIFFGSRAAQAMNDPVLNEMSRLEQEGVHTIITTTTYKPVKLAKAELSNKKYQEYLGNIQQEVKQKLDLLITTDKYQKASDDNKAILLKNVREEAVKDVSRQMGYERFIKNWNPSSTKLKKEPLDN